MPGRLSMKLYIWESEDLILMKIWHEPVTQWTGQTRRTTKKVTFSTGARSWMKCYRDIAHTRLNEMTLREPLTMKAKAIGFLLMMLYAATAEARGWRGIVPLHTTRS